MPRLVLLLAVGAAVGGCGRKPEPAPSQAPLPLPVHVLADTAGPQRLRVVPPSVWVARVAPSRWPTPQPALPDAAPDSLVPQPPPPLEIDAGLKPPILRHQGVLVLPPGEARRRPGNAVELDVRVDEAGEVSQALWAAGSRDTSWVNAALRCAQTMRFFPALRAGRPVAVWCRQRFDFGR